jgi:hypothetical protein
MDERSAAILEVIRQLPAKTITATMRNPNSSAERTFTGPTLFDYAVATKLFAAKMGGGTLANSYFIVTAEDGARSAVALGEVWPNASDKDVLVAYQQDGEDIRNGVRLVVTGDGLAGRSIGGVVSIDAATVKADPAPAGTLDLIGDVDRPGPVDLSALPADAYTEVTTVAAVGTCGHRDRSPHVRRLSPVFDPRARGHPDRRAPARRLRRQGRRCEQHRRPFSGDRGW